MLEDADPRNYTYDDAVSVLSRLGFTLAPHGGTSHRKWRYRRADGLVVVVGLVEKGHGTLKPVYVRDMVCQLRENGLVPSETEDANDVE